MPVTRNTRANTREVPAGRASQRRQAPSAVAEDVTRQLQKLRITSIDEKPHRLSRSSQRAGAFTAHQPNPVDQSQLVHPETSTLPVFRPVKKGVRREPYSTDTPALPSRVTRSKHAQAQHLVGLQTERERPSQSSPPDTPISTFVERDLVNSLSTQLHLSSVAPTTTPVPLTSSVSVPGCGHLDVGTLKKTLDGILAENDPAPSLGGSYCSSLISGSSLPSPTSSVTPLSIVVAHETAYEVKRAYGKVETAKSIKGSRQTRQAGPPKDPHAIPPAVISAFNSVNGVQCTIHECRELLKYKYPDPRRVYQANPGNPQKAKEILAQHRVIWGLHYSLRFYLTQWNDSYDAEDDE
ncbi:hypothetical protein FRC17_004235 [Serendipita sp. 399]|nr:hypothetical protein FRC17_004235 [Serendipita sp. 399]